MSASFQLILEEIKPIDPIVSPTPYDDFTPIPARIPMIFRQLLKAKRMNNRILILEKAFYIGQIIEDELTPAQWIVAKTIMTEYYYRLPNIRNWLVWDYPLQMLLGIHQRMNH